MDFEELDDGKWTIEGPWTTDYGRWIIDDHYQLSKTNHQPSTTNHQLSSFNNQLTTADDNSLPRLWKYKKKSSCF